VQFWLPLQYAAGQLMVVVPQLAQFAFPHEALQLKHLPPEHTRWQVAGLELKLQSRFPLQYE
jgi:hypothetical protein